MTGQAVETKHEAESKGTDIAKFVLCSALGIFMFFISVTFGGKSTIPLDHLTTIVRGALGEAQKWVVLAVIAAGAALPFVKKTWNQSTQSVVFSVFKVVGLICGIMYMFHLTPSLLAAGSMMQFGEALMIRSSGRFCARYHAETLLICLSQNFSICSSKSSIMQRKLKNVCSKRNLGIFSALAESRISPASVHR
ncbi:hypothetical protein ACTQ56_09225 [[Clostridium] aminophilum]|uniref:hypothetical protein n=1 Tax=[Clostridium] aminophilum TaxID=1526 RepID=UPI003F9599C9